MKFNNLEKPENNRDISRRDFIKKTGLTLAGLVLGANNLTNNLPKTPLENVEQKEGLCIKKREVWDKKWKQLRTQYQKKLGETYYIREKNKTLERQALVYSYLDSNNETPTPLEKELKRIVIHHSEVDVDQSPVDEVSGVRDFHIDKRGWSDVGYHYAIASDGQIFEGRPVDRVGSHAGSTIEQKDEFKENFGENYKSLNPNNPDYLEKFNQFKNTIKKDPDYGSIGIVLLGNFSVDQKGTKAQFDSLKNLLNHLKGEYEIPKDNIIYHSEVEDLVVKASSFRLNSPKTDCPGDHFLSKEHIVRDLDADTEKAKCKSILLE